MAILSRERVKHWRELRGLSQEELGDRCGMTQYKISRIETGKTEASADDIELIATKGFGVSMPEFYGAEEKAS